MVQYLFVIFLTFFIHFKADQLSYYILSCFYTKNPSLNVPKIRHKKSPKTCFSAKKIKADTCQSFWNWRDFGCLAYGKWSFKTDLPKYQKKKESVLFVTYFLRRILTVSGKIRYTKTLRFNSDVFNIFRYFFYSK